MEASKILTRKEPLSEGEWLSMIENRLHVMIGEGFENYNLWRLGDTRCLVQEGILRREIAKEAKIESTCPWISLETMCIPIMASARPFIETPNGKSIEKEGYIYRDGTTSFAILTKGDFLGHKIILVSVRFSVQEYSGHTYEEANLVQVSDPGILEICKQLQVDPVFIWKKLGEEIRSHARISQNVYEKAYKMATRVEIENAMHQTLTEHLGE